MSCGATPSAPVVGRPPRTTNGCAAAPKVGWGGRSAWAMPAQAALRRRRTVQQTAPIRAATVQAGSGTGVIVSESIVPL